MPVVNEANLNYEGLHITQADYVASKDEGDEIAPGEIAQVAKFEVGDDGQLSSYDAVRLGDRTDERGKSAQGKLFVDLFDDGEEGGEALDTRTQVRWVARDKNSNRRKPLTRWYPLRDLAQDRPDLRTPLAPVTSNGKPMIVKSGRIIELEVKNQAVPVTVSLANSVFETPARGGW